MRRVHAARGNQSEHGGRVAASGSSAMAHYIPYLPRRRRRSRRCRHADEAQLPHVRRSGLGMERVHAVCVARCVAVAAQPEAV